jgi:hypothetical protein
MTATTYITRAATLAPSFSFYVPSTDINLITDCAEKADGVVVHGTQGPRVVEGMRRDGFSGVVLFDRGGYERGAASVDPAEWCEAQERAGADRILTSGHWAAWDDNVDALQMAVDAARQEVKSVPGASILLAVDSRWITNSKGLYRTISVLKEVPEPLAIVLSHRDDPLSAQEAVNNLLALTRNVPRLSFLRSDHGAIGAVAIGAIHGSIGLIPKYRHFVPPTAAGGGIPDRTPRVFVWDLMDWFAASTIAGWGASSVSIKCTFDCCGGRGLDRFLDSRLVDEAGQHNRTVLSHLGAYILDAEPVDRRGEFSRLCNRALEHYGPMGKLSHVTRPKSQLLQWAQFAYPQFR